MRQVAAIDTVKKKVRVLFAFLRQGLAMYHRLASNSQKSCNLPVSVSQIALTLNQEPGEAMEAFMQPTDLALRRVWTRDECCGQDLRERPVEESR